MLLKWKEVTLSGDGNTILNLNHFHFYADVSVSVDGRGARGQLGVVSKSLEVLIVLLLHDHLSSLSREKIKMQVATWLRQSIILGADGQTRQEEKMMMYL